MPPIPHKYLEKLGKEVSDLSNWLADTRPQPDDSANPEDLKALYNKVYSIYQKTILLYQTTLQNSTEAGGLEELRLDVAKFDHWLSTIQNQPSLEDLQTIFTRANAINLKALGVYRHSAQGGVQQEQAGDDEHVSLSGS